MSDSENTVFPYSLEFKTSIVALMLKRSDFLNMAMEVVKPEYFREKPLIWLFGVITSFFKDKGQVPNKEILLEEVRKIVVNKRLSMEEGIAYGKTIHKLFLPLTNEDYYISETVKFCRIREAQRVFNDYGDRLPTAEDSLWDEFLEKMFDIRKIGLNHLDVGIGYFETSHQRMSRRLNGEVVKQSKTGISAAWDVKNSSEETIDLDQLIGGGLKAGQLGVWLGGTGRGKSLALSRCAQRALYEDGWKVLHYTLELSADTIADRYDAALTKTPFSSLNYNAKDVHLDLSKLASKHRFDNRLIIKEYPTGSASISTIKTHIRNLAQVGWVPDVIIVDYLDLLKPLTKYDNEYENLGAIAVDLRGLAGELGVPVWTATQTNRAGLNQDIVDVSVIGDSLKKAMIADVVLGICMNKEERYNKVARIYMAKNRNGPEGSEIIFNTNYEQMRFYEIGYHRPELGLVEIDDDAKPIMPNKLSGTDPSGKPYRNGKRKQ